MCEFVSNISPMWVS
jgi:hypothetical protein